MPSRVASLLIQLVYVTINVLRWFSKICGYAQKMGCSVVAGMLLEQKISTALKECVLNINAQEGDLLQKGWPMPARVRR